MSQWPDIPYARWAPSGASLHMWAQIVGKFRMSLAPWINHSWQATFYVNARGLTTSLIPGPTRGYEVVFDFVDHQLVVMTTDGVTRRLPLRDGSVADFHTAFIELLRGLGAPTDLHDRPNEVADPVPFAYQTAAGRYDPDAARDFWQALVAIDAVFKTFRTGFLGKVSPVHLFWGSFDLAVTRFSGRPAPLHPGGIPALPDRVTREAYSHEVSSAGFWPGGGGIDEPAFYSYAYPAPEGFRGAPNVPAEAFYSDALGEFILPYDAVRRAAEPERLLLGFLQSTYEAAAVLAGWDRPALECPLGEPGVPRPLLGDLNT
ncbi:MAG: DUF5996 family protein [Pseudomonadota bacterium]